MALTDKIRRFLGSPQGKQAVARGRRELEKPANRRRLQQVLRKISGRRY
ncbi:hypothetical protein [Desertihabitans aurantiacus]|nr:hypothetical protein [Desertihabitans aurantiacus]